MWWHPPPRRDSERQAGGRAAGAGRHFAGDRRLKAIRRLQAKTHDFIVLNLPAEVDEVAPYRPAPHALFCLALMVAMMLTDEIPNPIPAALIARLLMGKFRCIDMERL